MSRIKEHFTAVKLNKIIKELKAKETYAYHYTSPEGFRGIFRENGNLTLWFTQYDSLNDKSERNHTFEYISEYCDRKVDENVFSKYFAKYIKDYKPFDYKHILVPKQTEHVSRFLSDCQLKQFECDIYICSFSKHNDLLPMWNYYSKSQRYEGYSIGFTTRDLVHHSSTNIMHDLELIDIIYEDDEKDALLDELLIPLSIVFDKKPTEIELCDIKGIINITFDRLQFAFKNSCFRHEHEMRLVLRVPKEFNNNTIKKINAEESLPKISERKYRTNNGYIIPYVEYTFPSCAAHSIKIAPLQEKEIAEKNVTDYLNRYGYRKCKVSSSDIPIRF